MTNSINDVLKFIFETEEKPSFDWFRKQELLTEFKMESTSGEATHRWVTNMEMTTFWEPMEVKTDSVLGLGTAYSFPVPFERVELTIATWDSAFIISELNPNNEVHRRYLKRAVLVCRALFPNEHWMGHKTIRIEALDMSKPDDIFVLRRITKGYCGTDGESFLLNWCDEFNLMEHKMIIMREINENRKANDSDIFRL